MKVIRKIIEIDEELCDGCGQCVPSCAEGALQVVDGKARVMGDMFCDGLGACLGECPTGALSILEREADDFDEEAVETHLAKMAKNEIEEKSTPCQCPSMQIETLISSKYSQEPDRTDAVHEDTPSALSHWPIQIRLIPPKAPFLKGADLLVLADCCGVAFPNLHPELLKGKVVMMGCPKFDDVQEYIMKFAEIFKIADIRHITSAVMEVPCCSGLPMIVKKGMELAGKQIPMEEIVISVRGQKL
ncbi:ATP-binding protein [Thermodesulfobacteriota bacterium]